MQKSQKIIPKRKPCFVVLRPFHYSENGRGWLFVSQNSHIGQCERNCEFIPWTSMFIAPFEFHSFYHKLLEEIPWGAWGPYNIRSIIAEEPWTWTIVHHPQNVFFMLSVESVILLGTNKSLEFYRVLAIDYLLHQRLMRVKKKHIIRLGIILYMICSTHWTERQFIPKREMYSAENKQPFLLLACELLLHSSDWS